MGIQRTPILSFGWAKSPLKKRETVTMPRKMLNTTVRMCLMRIVTAPSCLFLLFILLLVKFGLMYDFLIDIFPVFF